MCRYVSLIQACCDCHKPLLELVTNAATKGGTTLVAQPLSANPVRRELCDEARWLSHDADAPMNWWARCNGGVEHVTETYLIGNRCAGCIRERGEQGTAYRQTPDTKTDPQTVIPNPTNSSNGDPATANNGSLLPVSLKAIINCVVNLNPWDIFIFINEYLEDPVAAFVGNPVAAVPATPWSSHRFVDDIARLLNERNDGKGPAAADNNHAGDHVERKITCGSVPRNPPSMEKLKAMLANRGPNNVYF
jgi:hypothetical protein